MSYIHHYIALLGCLLLLVAAPLTLLRQPRYPRKVVTIAMFLMLGLAILPIYDQIPLVYMRAVITDLSITSLFLLCLFIATAYTGEAYLADQNRQTVYRSVLLGAVLLYPLALGLTPYDSYALGYGSPIMFIGLALFAYYLLWRRAYVVLGLLLVAIVAYLVGILNSDNLWDYLMDPWVFFVAVFDSIKRLVLRPKNTTP